MKWITGISITVAVILAAVLLLIVKRGVYLPPRIEDMTVLEDDIQGSEKTNSFENLFITLSNQTHKEISVSALLDEGICFGGAIIRDQHFGMSWLGVRVKPGNHTLELSVAGRPPVMHSLSFVTEKKKILFLDISILKNEAGGFEFVVKESDGALGIM